ncbi:MAG: exopolyphosphatase, partial [Candidatus Rokubacteria bacterium]|nr:exopolyphosphatase [Candidatus Rokubacteria bacterium]
MPRRAAIDVGTNTVRLLVVEGETREGLRVLHEEQIITRLGQGLAPGKPLHPEAARSRGVAEIQVIGTSALREARDPSAFARALRETTGLDLLVISGEEEARLALLGTRWGLELPSHFLLMDIGGG